MDKPDDIVDPDTDKDLSSEMSDVLKSSPPAQVATTSSNNNSTAPSSSSSSGVVQADQQAPEVPSETRSQMPSGNAPAEIIEAKSQSPKLPVTHTLDPEVNIDATDSKDGEDDVYLVEKTPVSTTTTTTTPVIKSTTPKRGLKRQRDADDGADSIDLVSERWKSVATELDKDVPRDLVLTRKGYGDRNVITYWNRSNNIERMGDVFGRLNWRSEVKKIIELPSGEVEMIIRVTIIDDNGRAITYHEDIGHGKTKDGPESSPYKSAYSDALKRTTQHFGRTMGNRWETRAQLAQRYAQAKKQAEAQARYQAEARQRQQQQQQVLQQQQRQQQQQQQQQRQVPNIAQSRQRLSPNATAVTSH